MIKRFTLFMSSLALMASAAIAGGNYTYDIIGTTFKVDTLFHAKVGPGTTQTSLLFTGPTYNLRAFYLTIDLATPNVSIRTVAGNDEVAGGERTSSMAQRHSKDGLQYFGGVNGDFFVTSGTTMRGVSTVGTPINACIVDGEIYKTSESWKQFAVDTNGVPFIGLASFTKGTAVCGDNTVRYSGVNVSSPSNAVTLYTPRYYGGTDMKTSNMAEVTVKLADGEKCEAGRSCKMIVTSEPSEAGDMDIPTDGFVLHGRGTSTSGFSTSAYNFVKNLKVGDVVTLNSVVTIDGEQIVPQQMISGNPRIAGNGETLDTEGERGDASGYHPRTAIGYGDNKSKVIMLVVDGRSSISNGARTSQVADIMRYAGATDAINLDGGGSSTLYTQALGIRNVPSDGSERSDGNAIFAVCDAPEDNEVAEIRFVDWAMQFPKYGIYVPKFYGYNKYGMLIDTDLKGAKLSCPAELGYVKEDGVTFVGNGSGTYALSATYNGITASIPVTIVPSEEVKMAHESIINDGYHEYTVEVKSKVLEDYMLLDAEALTWSSSDASIVEIDAQKGILKGVANGEAFVKGSLNDFESEMKVIVEKPSARYMPLETAIAPSSWTVNQVGGTGSLSTLGDGLRYTYTGKSSRAPYIKFSRNIKVYSLPDTLRLRINPGDAPVNKVQFYMESANGVKENITVSATALEPNKESVIDLATDSWCNISDISSFPITLGYIYLTMGASTSGKEYTIDMPGIEAVYDAVKETGGVGAIDADKQSFVIAPNPVKRGADVEVKLAGASAVKIFDIAGALIAEKAVEGDTCRFSTAALSAGAYIVTVETATGSKASAKLIVK